ncbi:Rossmann-like and DUF2520 domain-containing protein [Sphaerotilus sp.]|jgi:predicted short-subunit dehydrogenase-like oxidoreductase (DUF2520 family)|uniref:Rossmann-like and DUF2520 domain-containing protein n=1 Tax=Sphaerotilus sp. TaxID=2093942 RepID=UPI0025E2E27C|nr:DUF2520 domain-containing protein [Sphaerotilus sp.]
MDRSDPPDRPRIALVGAGRVAQALVIALARAGWPVAAVGSRHPEHLSAATYPQPCTLQQAVDQADLVLLTVADDAIAPVAAALRWRAGQAVVHCSGATEVAALDPAARAGAQTGGFHPLQIFSDPVLAAHRLAGSTAAVEAGPALMPTLQALAAALQMRATVLPPGMRVRYHVAAGYAASFLLPVLQEAVALWAEFGVDEAEALQALLPLSRGTLDAAAARGLAGALSGPIARGDVGVVARHLAELTALGPQRVGFYRGLAASQPALAQRAGRLDEDLRKRLEYLLQARDC